MSAAKRGAAKGPAKRAAAKTPGKAPGKAPARAAGKGAAKGVAKSAAKGAVGGAKRAAAKAAPRTAPVKRAAGGAGPVVFTGRGGARVWGTKHPAAQLTERQVIRFRKLVRDGKATVGELAVQAGCGHSRISMAVRGQTWAHLNEVAPPVG